MMVSDKMIKACKDAAYAYGPGNITIDIENAQETAQAAIDAAWTAFDPDDKDTWPKSVYAPSGMPWLIDETYLGKRRIGDRPYYGERDTLWFEHLTAYADPVDVMPSFSKREGEK